MAIKDWVITVNRETKPASQKGFGTVLILATDKEQDYKKYDDLEAVEEDFSSDDKAYKIASVIFQQEPQPTEVAIKGVAISEPDEEGEGGFNEDDVVDALKDEDEDFYFLVTDSREDDLVKAVADWIETQQKMYAFSSDDHELMEFLEDKEYENTFGFEHDEPETYPAEAIVGLCASTDPGSITWAYKEPKGIKASKVDVNEALDVNANVILKQHGKVYSYEGKTFSGEYIDVIRSGHYLYARIDESVFNTLMRNGKVPYDNNGIAMIEAAVEAPIKRAANNGMVAEEDGDFLYEVSAPKRKDTTENERADRFLPNIKADVTLAGAIHKGNITITVKL